MIICKLNSQSILQIFADLGIQNAQLVIIGKWKTVFNKKLKEGALFMDLPKVFDTLDYSVLLVKLSVYGFDNSLSFIQSF